MTRHSAISRADKSRLSIEIVLNEYGHPEIVECYINGVVVSPEEAYEAWRAHLEICEAAYPDGDPTKVMMYHPFNLLPKPDAR